MAPMIRGCELRKTHNNLPQEAGIYKWYANKESCAEIFSRFKDWRKIFEGVDTRNINGEECYLIYVGTTSRKNGGIRNRLSWHICQRHDLNAVKNGTLSTFRQSLSSMLSEDQSDEAKTNEALDKLWVEYETLPLSCGNEETIKIIESKESELINKFHPPLNIRSNNPDTKTKKEFKKFLTKLRGESKKKALQNF